MKYSVRSLLISGRSVESFLADRDHLSIAKIRDVSKGAIKLYYFYLAMPPSVVMDDTYVAMELGITKQTLMKFRRELTAKQLMLKERTKTKTGQAFIYLAPASGERTLDDVISYWKQFDQPYTDYLEGIQNGDIK